MQMAFLMVKRFAAAVAEVGVEVADQAEAIAAEFEAVGAHAHAVLADVEGVLAALGGAGVAVGNDHLGERGAVEDGAFAAVVVVAEVVQRQSLAGVEADDEAPLLPGDLIAVDLEARSLGLDDLQRLDVLARCGNPVGGVVRLARWDRPAAVLLDADDVHGVEVHDGPQSLDRADVAVVGRVGAEEAERPGEPHGAVLLGAVVAGAPDVDHDEAGVLDARELLEGRLEHGAGQDGLLALDLLVDRHRRLHAGDVLPVEQGAVGQGEGCLVAGVGGVVEEDGEGLPGRGLLAVPVMDEVLRRLSQHDRDKPGGWGDLAGLPESLDGLSHFPGRQRLQRVEVGDEAGGRDGRDVDQVGHGTSDCARILQFPPGEGTGSPGETEEPS